MGRVREDSIMGRLRMMEVGEEHTFPIEKLQYLYKTCSVFARTIKKRYTTTHDDDTVTIRRVA